MNADLTREQRLVETFVDLADTLVAGFDVVEFLHGLADRCVELLDIAAAGLMLDDQRGVLRVVAASTEQARLLELCELEADEGPCVSCYHAGAAVSDLDLVHPDPRWPRFAAQAAAAGFASVHALPLRLRNEVIGVLNLFSTRPLPLDEHSRRIGQALADVATIGLLQERAIRQRQILTEQLQGALNSRILIEQAKGVLAERLGLDMDAAFSQLRAQSRRLNRHLTDVARETITNSVGTTSLNADEPG
jgi:transcriptional regulator with GAF, ATPase, and Fis domain